MRQYIFLPIVVCFFVACSSEEQCPSNPDALIVAYQSYLEDVKNTDRFYSTKQWEEKEKMHDQLIEKCYPAMESQMSESQEEQLWSSVIEFYLFRQKGNIQVIFDKSIPRYNLLQSKIKQIWPDPKIAFEQVFKHATDLDFMQVLKEMNQEMPKK